MRLRPRTPAPRASVMLPSLVSFPSVSSLISVVAPFPIFAAILVSQSAKIPMRATRLNNPLIVVNILSTIVDVIIPVDGIVGAVSVASEDRAADQQRRSKQSHKG